MKQSHYILFLLLLFIFKANTQIIPKNRMVDWSKAGTPTHVPIKSISILDFGAISDGKSDCSTALQNAINSFKKKAGKIVIPKGNYFFTKPIYLEDSIVIKGEDPDSTFLNFRLQGSQECLSAIGSIDTTRYLLIKDGLKDSFLITAKTMSKIGKGDYIKISENSNGRIFSEWAEDAIGQIILVKDIHGDEIILQDALRMTFSLKNGARIQKITTRKAIGIECISIVRLDSVTAQNSNIYFNYAVHSWVSGVNSKYCNFAHITMENSNNILVNNCYFTKGYGYGGGGRAYGTVLQFTSGNCLIFNNIFEHLRHSVLLQAGVNGNVISYNYSFDPYWEEALYPSDFGGDLVCHGNFVFANLFEGNICSKMSIDNSHGINGPYNTFFRNRSEKYGFSINFGAGSSMNFIANELPHPSALISTFGTDHLIIGNVLKGILTPAGSQSISEKSLYLNELPICYFEDPDIEIIGPPYKYNYFINKAKERSLNGFRGFCLNCNSLQNLSIQGSSEVCLDVPSEYTTSYIPCIQYEWRSNKTTDILEASTPQNRVKYTSNSIGYNELHYLSNYKDEHNKCTEKITKSINVKLCTAITNPSSITWRHSEKGIQISGLQNVGYLLRLSDIKGCKLFEKIMNQDSYFIDLESYDFQLLFLQIISTNNHKVYTIKIKRS